MTVDPQYLVQPRDSGNSGFRKLGFTKLGTQETVLVIEGKTFRGPIIKTCWS